MAITAETRTDIIDLVVAALDVAPGTTLLTELVALVDDGGTLADVAANLTARSDYKTKYPGFQTANEWATEWLGNLIPEADTATMAAAVTIAEGMINSGSTQAAIVLEAATFLAGATADATYGTVATAFVNNSAVAEYHTVTKEVAAIGTSALDGVGSTDASVTTAKAALDVVAAVPGSTFTLTTGLDTGTSFTGGAGDDSFVGVDNNVATTGTLTAGDSLVGGDGSDSLTIAASGTASVPVVSTSSIETLKITNNSGAGVTYSASLMDGLTDVEVTAGLQATTISNSKVLLDVTAINTSKNITVTSATPALGAADSSNITLTGVGTAAATTITSDGVETFNVTLSGAASGSATLGNVTLASNELETVKVTGDVAALITVDLTGADLVTQTATFDATGTSAGITADVTAGGSTKLAVTGGTGNDKITVGALDKDYTIEGGDGTDTLVATGSYSTSLAAASQVGVGVTGFETISAASAGTIDLRSMANNTFTATTGAGTYSKAGAEIANSYLTATSGTLTLTRGTDTSADALNVHLTPAAAAATVSVSIANEETVTVNSAGVVTNVDHTISSLAAADMTKLSVIGHNGLIISSLTGEESLATIDASGHSGKAFTIDATQSNVAMTVTASAGAPVTLGATVNTITTGSGADSITGGDYADSITSGLGADTITAGAGNDTITSSNGNDSIVAGAGDDSITAGSGSDNISGGDGNDTIDAGSGTDTVDGGAGNDRIVATVNDSTNITGGAGTDTLQNTTSAITSSTASSVAGALLSVTESVTPTISGVETAYLLIDGDASAAASATTVIVDLASATDLATLHLGTDETTNDGSFIKVKDFAGSTVKMYGGISGTTEEIEFLTLDGTGQAAMNLTLENWNGSGATDTLTVTGTSALNITGRSTSQFTGAAAQDNVLGDITAASVGTFTVTTSGSTSTSNGASALTIDEVTATQAGTVNLTVGAKDDLALDVINATGDAVETSTITVGDDAILDVDTLNYDASTLDSMTLTVGDAGTVSNSTNTSLATTEYVDITATTISDFNITLNAGANATLDLSTITNTDLDASLASSSNLVLKSSLGTASTASNFTFTGRGDLDFDDATRIGAPSVNLVGSTVVFNTSGLTIDSDAVAVHSDASTSASITTGLGADRVSGGAGADTISTGDGADKVGLTDRVETFTIATSGDVDNADTLKFTINGVDTAATAQGTTVTAAATAMAAAVNAITETAYATATSSLGVVTVTYQQYFGTAGTATEVADNDNDMSTTVAATTDGDNAGADSITLGEGADTVIGGSGNDTITLTEVSSAADVVDFLANGSGKDTITGFTTTSDKLSFDGLTGITATSGTAVAADAATQNITDAAVYVFADGADGTGAETITSYTDLDDVAAFLAAAFNDEAASDENVFVINDLVGNKTYIYYSDFDLGNGGAGLLDDEALTLIGVVTESAGAAIVSGDIA